MLDEREIFMAVSRLSFRALLTGLGLGAGLAFVGGLAAPAMAQDQVGLLECNVAPGVGLVVTSSHALSCRFSPADNTPPDYYVGTINKFGLDIGFTGAGRLVWGVVAPSIVPAHALTGRYVGAMGQATIGIGLGGNALIGGSNQTITLQPLSVSAQTGLNLAAGVGDLTLEPAPGGRPHFYRHHYHHHYWHHHHLHHRHHHAK